MDSSQRAPCSQTFPKGTSCRYIWLGGRGGEEKQNCISLLKKKKTVLYILGFPGGSDNEEFTCNARDLDSVPALGRSHGGGRGNPLQCFCLETPHGQRSLAGYCLWVTKSRTQLKWLSTAYIYSLMKNNSHTMQFSHLKYIIQWFLVYSHRCTEPIFRTFHHTHPHQRNFFLISSHSPSLPSIPTSASSWQPPTHFVSHGFAYSGCFT